MQRVLQKSFLWVVLIAGTHGTAFAAAADHFYLRSGDTVVFYGDSITEQRLYTMFTELYTVTRYPNLNVRFIHSGWGGDRVSGGGGGTIDVRLRRDVIAYKPSVVTIMLGMNDGNYADHSPADDAAFYSGYRHIISNLREAIPALRITAIEPSPFDDVTRPLTLQPNGYNAVLVNYGAWIRRYAAEAKFDLADLNTGVVEMLRKANAADPATARKIIPDRVHPAAAGHLVMAEQLLKAWNARAIVSAVTIDAAHTKVTRAEFARITDLHARDPFVWTEIDEALPLPFAQLLGTDPDRTVGLAIRSSDITEALNQEPLRIIGLSAGKYKLTIDGDVIGTWSDAELARGVNLAILNTPMSRQAIEVRNLTVRRVEIHQFRWRNLQVPLNDLDLEHLDGSLKALDALDGDLAARQRAVAQPRPHVFQLAPAT